MLLDKRPLTAGLDADVSSSISVKLSGEEGAPQPVGQPGSFVDIALPHGRLLGIVVSARLAGLPRGDSGRGGADATNVEEDHRLLDVQPIGTLNADGSFERGADSLPVIGAEVFRVSPETLQKVFATRSPGSLAIGKLSAMRQQEAFIDLDALLGRHLAIVGQTGAGKSWTVASILQKIARLPKSTIVLLDLHGEYSQAFGSSATSISAADLELPYWLMNAEELIDLCLERQEQSASMQIAKFKEILQHAKETYKENATLGIPKITVDTPVYFEFQTVMRELERLDGELVLVNLVRTHGPFYGLFTRPLIRLQSRLNDKRFDPIFHPKKHATSASMESLFRRLLGEEQKPSKLSILDLSQVPFEVRPSVISLILRCLFDFAYWHKRKTGQPYPLAVFCDEAHAYLNDADPSHEASRLSAERIAKEGRKYGISLAIISQRPREVSSTILSQCGSFFCLRLSSPEDQAYVRNLLPDSMRSLTSVLSTLRQGETLVVGDAIMMPTRVRMDPPDPKPDSGDVSFLKSWSAPHKPIDVAGVLDLWRKQGLKKS